MQAAQARRRLNETWNTVSVSWHFLMSEFWVGGRRFLGRREWVDCEDIWTLLTLFNSLSLKTFECNKKVSMVGVDILVVLFEWELSLWEWESLSVFPGDDWTRSQTITNNYWGPNNINKSSITRCNSDSKMFTLSVVVLMKTVTTL